MAKLPPIPETITLYGIQVATFYNPTLFADRKIYGESCGREETITLDSNLSLEKQWVIYCHELIEIMLDLNLVEIEDESEKQILALGWYQILTQTYFKKVESSTS